jgi:hypothetical protein
MYVWLIFIKQKSKLLAKVAAILPKNRRSFNFVIYAVPLPVQLDEDVQAECIKFSGDVKFFAEFQTGIRHFYPWLVSAGLYLL